MYRNNLSLSKLLFSTILYFLASSAIADTENKNTVRFTETPLPQTPAEMAQTRTQSRLVIRDTHGKETTYSLHYHTLFSVKDKIGQYEAGRLYDKDMTPLNDHLGNPAIAETPDGNSLLVVNNTPYLITHYEYDWINSDGSLVKPIRRPMSMTITTLKQSPTGTLSAVAQQPINFSSVNGLWIPCNATQTPWNTHLGSEEDYDLQYNPLNKYYERTLNGLIAMKQHYGLSNPNPYHYGYLPEVSISSTGKASVVKHYGMGRGTWELGKVMPDGKTVYFGDDGTNVGLIMFVANEANNLASGGSLYAAKWQQTSPSGSDGGSANLTWIKLGSSKSDHEIKQLADNLSFDDIFNNTPFDASIKGCTSGQQIRAGSELDECLSIKANKETAAAFLETRRMAALKGATTEFTKMEGITYNHQDRKLYIAMSYIQKGMKSAETEPANHIQLKENKAGGIYQLDLNAQVQDNDQQPILSDYVASQMVILPKLLGKPITKDELGNKADPNAIANPDNIYFSPSLRTLFIGEDSADHHVNNMLWAYHVDDKQLTRLMTLPVGAESTGLQVVEDLNGHLIIMTNSQHHGDWHTGDSPITDEALTLIDKFDAKVGYIGGIPTIK